MDFKNMGAKKVCVVTDVNVAKLDAMKQVIEGLETEGISYTVYERTQVEPKDSSSVPTMSPEGLSRLTDHVLQYPRSYCLCQTLCSRRLSCRWRWLRH